MTDSENDQDAVGDPALQVEETSVDSSALGHEGSSIEQEEAHTSSDPNEEQASVKAEHGHPVSSRPKRSVVLPTRVRDGCFTESYLDAGGEHIPWAEIEFVSLAIIDQMVKDSEPKKGPLTNMVQKVTRGGEGRESNKAKPRETRDVYILDVHTTLQDRPFRFDGASINYKSFLDRAGYVSHHNFYRFVVRLCRQIPQAMITTSLAAFLAKRRERIAHFSDYYDYELETEQQRRHLRDVLPVSEVDLSNDSWVEEFGIDE